MSSIASNAEDLILNADGGSSTVKIKINGTEKASISSAGAFTSTTIDATKLTGALPAISGAALTGLASPAITKVTEAYASTSRTGFGYSRDLFASNLNFVGHKVAFTFTKDSANTDLLIQFSMSVAYFRDTFTTAVYTGSSGAATNIKRFSFNGTNSIGSNAFTPMLVTGQAIWTGIGSGTQTWYWAMGRANDAYNSSYVLNPNTSDNAQCTGDNYSNIIVYEGDFD